MSNDVDRFLEHFGVKGMRWGVRRTDEQLARASKGKKDSSSKSEKESTSKPKKLTRQEVRQEKREFYEKKASRILAEAAEKPDVLVSVLTPHSQFPTVVSGREFVDYARRGGAFNTRVSDIYARKENGSYVINTNMNERYRRSDKK